MYLNCSSLFNIHVSSFFVWKIRLCRCRLQTLCVCTRTWKSGGSQREEIHLHFHSPAVMHATVFKKRTAMYIEGLEAETNILFLICVFFASQGGEIYQQSYFLLPYATLIFFTCQMVKFICHWLVASGTFGAGLEVWEPVREKRWAASNRTESACTLFLTWRGVVVKSSVKQETREDSWASKVCT